MNGISEKSQRAISEKVSEKFLAKLRSNPDYKLTSKEVMRELLMETGYPVDSKDFISLQTLTLCKIIGGE